MAKKKPAPRATYLNRKNAYEPGGHPVHVYLSGLGEDSARVMGSALDSIADMLSDGRRTAEDLAWHLVRPQHVATLRGRLQKLYAPATANRYLTALRAVLKCPVPLNQPAGGALRPVSRRQIPGCQNGRGGWDGAALSMVRGAISAAA